MTLPLNRTLFYLFMLLIMLAPLPLGSNREWSWTLCAALTGVIGLVWVVRALIRPASVSRLVHPLLIIGFIAVCAWALLQTSPAVPQGWGHPLWALSAEVLGDGAPATVSLSPDETFTATMRLLMYGLVFYLSFQWGRDEYLARRALQLLVFAGMAYAVFGLAKYWSGSTTLFWFENNGYKSSVHSTFVNRNHFATWQGLTLLCLMAWFYQIQQTQIQDRLSN